MKTTKKLFFMLTAILFGITSIAQTQNDKTVARGLLNSVVSETSVHATESALTHDFFKTGHQSAKGTKNTILLSEDFSSTTFPPPGWVVDIVTGTLGWSRGVGSQTYANFNTNGTTAANGYAFVDSDGNGGSGGPEHTTLRTPAINCMGHSHVWLRFNNYFYQFVASTGEVQVSNNGTTWHTVHEPHLGLGQNDATPNPQFIDVNISAWAANQATVYVRFKWTGSYDYYWFVDDVEVYARDPYDVGLIAAENLNEYSVAPLVHYNNQPLQLGATVKNFGGATATNVHVTFNVYDGFANSLLHTDVSNIAAALVSDATVNLTAAPYTIPLDTGFYITEYIVSMAQQDANPANDTIYQAFWISDTIYARDDAVFTGALYGSLGIDSGATALMGQNYTLNATDVLSRVSFYVTGQEIGDTTQAFVYSTLPDGTPNTLIASTPYHVFTQDTAGWVSLQFAGGPLSLNVGTYYIGVKDFHDTGILGLAYTVHNFTPGKTWLRINNDPWDKSEDLGFPCAFIIRPYFVCAGFMPGVSPGYNVGICQGLDATLTATAGQSYLWSPGGETTQSITVNTPGTYSVEVTNIYGCAATSPTVTVVVAQAPEVNLGNDTTVCGSYTLDAGGPFANYSWSGGTSSNQYLNVTSTGKYIVVVTDTLGCVGIDSIDIYVNPLPNINLGGNQNLCDYETATLDAGTGFASYLWSTQETTPVIYVDGNTWGVGSHEFWVEVIDANQCKNSDTVTVTFIVCTDVKNNVAEEAFQVYPNPATTTLHLRLPEQFSHEIISIKIFDALGRLVLNETTYERHLELDVNHFPAGIYQLTLKSREKVHTQTILLVE